jgi:hypothetical protein
LKRSGDRQTALRARRLADGVRRSGSALVLELRPLELRPLVREELAELLAAHAGHPLTYRWRPQAADWLAERLAGEA